MCETESGWYFDVLDIAIKGLKQRVEVNDIKSYMKSVSILQQIQDFRSIKLDVGRGIGKTSYIASRASQKDLIMFSCQTQKRIFAYADIDAIYLSGSIRDFERKLFGKSMEYETIWIDDFSRLERDYGANRILTILSWHLRKDKLPIFVLLG